MDNYEVDIIENISALQFKKEYLKNKKTMLLKGGCKNWQATKKWGLEYFQENFSDTRVPVKRFDGGKIIQEQQTLGQYCDQLRRYEQNKDELLPPYCHDIPIFNAEPKFKDDIGDESIKMWGAN